MSQTILPKNKKNPVQTGRLERVSFADTRRRFKRITKDIMALLERIPRQKIDADTGEVVVNQVVYEYLLDAFQLQRITEQIGLIINRDLTNEFGRWYLEPYVTDAYAQGTAESVINLQSIGGDEYGRTIEQVLSSQAYRDRILFTVTRVFELMEGFSEDMRVDLSRVLGEAMAAGDNPRSVAKKIRDRIGVNQSRALRIARTEISQAHRRARWQEAESASRQLGITTKMLHISALIAPVNGKGGTRATHAARHGRVFTRKEIEDWYQVDGNAINCRCSQVEILVDKKGNPIDESIITRTKKDGKEFFDTFGTGKKAA